MQPHAAIEQSITPPQSAAVPMQNKRWTITAVVLQQVMRPPGYAYSGAMPG